MTPNLERCRSLERVTLNPDGSVVAERFHDHVRQAKKEPPNITKSVFMIVLALAGLIAKVLMY